MMTLTLGKLLDILDAYSQVSATGLPLAELAKVTQVAIAVVLGKSLVDVLRDAQAGELINQVLACFDPDLALLKVLDSEMLALGRAVVQQVQRIRQGEDLSATTLLEAVQQMSQLLPRERVALLELTQRVIQRVAVLMGLGAGQILVDEVLLKYRSLAQQVTRSPQQHARELAAQVTAEVIAFHNERSQTSVDLTEPIAENPPTGSSLAGGLRPIALRSQLTAPPAAASPDCPSP